MDEKAHAVQFMAILPRGLDEAAFRVLLLRCSRTVHTRHALDAAEPPHSSAAGPGGA